MISPPRALVYVLMLLSIGIVIGSWLKGAYTGPQATILVSALALFGLLVLISDKRFWRE